MYLQHQYIGGILPVAPVDSEHAAQHSDFADFFMLATQIYWYKIPVVSSIEVLVLYKGKRQVCSTLENCLPYLFSCREQKGK
jgi:hypothetical protein